MSFRFKVYYLHPRLVAQWLPDAAGRVFESLLRHEPHAQSPTEVDCFSHHPDLNSIRMIPVRRRALVQARATNAARYGGADLPWNVVSGAADGGTRV